MRGRAGLGALLCRLGALLGRSRTFCTFVATPEFARTKRTKFTRWKLAPSENRIKKAAIQSDFKRITWYNRWENEALHCIQTSCGSRLGLWVDRVAT